MVQEGRTRRKKADQTFLARIVAALRDVNRGGWSVNCADSERSTAELGGVRNLTVAFNRGANDRELREHLANTLAVQ